MDRRAFVRRHLTHSRIVCGGLAGIGEKAPARREGPLLEP